MATLPSPDEVRALLLPLDDGERKIVGGLCAFLMAEPHKAKDREWLSQRFVELCVVAQGGEDGDGAATSEDVSRVQAYARSRMQPLVGAAMALFVRTAVDLQETGDATMTRANEIVRAYLQIDQG